MCFTTKISKTKKLIIGPLSLFLFIYLYLYKKGFREKVGRIVLCLNGNIGNIIKIFSAIFLVSLVILTVKVGHSVNNVNKILEKIGEEDLRVIINSITNLSDNLARIIGGIDEKEIGKLVKNVSEFLANPIKFKLW